MHRNNKEKKKGCCKSWGKRYIWCHQYSSFGE